MRNEKLIPGLILVLIGAAILLCNFGVLHFHWYNIFHLWPIFLVIAGINLVFAHNKAPWATGLKIAVVIAGFGLLFFGNFSDNYNFWPHSHYNFNNNDNSDNNDADNNNDSDDNSDKGAVIPMTGKGDFVKTYTTDIKIARLNISGGGTVYSIGDTTNQLFKANVKENEHMHYELTQHKDGDDYVLDFHMQDHKGLNFDSKNDLATIALNPNPEWKIKVETGAAKIDFDLNKFKIRELKLDGAAAAFNIKLGAPLDQTDVEIENAASSVTINIPKDAACRIETDSGLSDNHFEGFTKTGDDNYETNGYDNAQKKFHIHISGFLSNFKVYRY